MSQLLLAGSPVSSSESRTQRGVTGKVRARGQQAQVPGKEAAKVSHGRRRVAERSHEERGGVRTVARQKNFVVS